MCKTTLFVTFTVTVAALFSVNVALRMGYSSNDVVRVCGDGESLLHSMQYFLIKEQRRLKSESGSQREIDKLAGYQRLIESNFRAWRAGSSYMRAGDVSKALAHYLSVHNSGVEEPFVQCTVGMLASITGDIPSAIGFMQLAVASKPAPDAGYHVALGDMYLGLGEVNTGLEEYTIALSYLRPGNTTQSSSANAKRRPVKQSLHAITLSNAYRGLAWRAIGTASPEGLVTASKHLRLAIGTGSGDHLSMALLASILSNKLTTTTTNHRNGDTNSHHKRDTRQSLSATAYWLNAALSVKPDEPVYHCAVAIDLLHTPPSHQLYRQLGLRSMHRQPIVATGSVISLTKIAGAVDTLHHKDIISFVSSLPLNTSWSALQWEYKRVSSGVMYHGDVGVDGSVVSTAIGHLQQATWLSQSYTAGLFELSSLLYLQRRFEEAQSLLAKSLAIVSDSIPGRLLTALMHSQLGQHGDCITHGNVALSLIRSSRPSTNQTTTSALTTKQPIDVSSPFHEEHVCRHVPRFSKQSLKEFEVLTRLLLLRSYVMTNQPSSAQQQVNALITVDPAVAFDVHLFHGYLAVDVGLYRDAVSVFGTALSLDSGSATVHRGLGLALYHRGSDHLKEAFTHFQHSVDIDPSDAISHSFLSLLYVDQRDIEMALKHGSTAAKSSPNHAFFRYQYGRLLGYVGSWDLALAEFMQALVLEPSCWQCHVAAAEAYAATGSLKAAAAELQIASTLQPQCMEIRCRLGSMMLSIGKVYSASASFDVAWELYHTPAKSTNITSSHRSQRHVLPIMQASDDTASCEAMANDDVAVCWNNAAVACLSLGYVEDGVQWLKEALKLKPSLKTAALNLKLTVEDGVTDRVTAAMLATEKQQPVSSNNNVTIDSGSAASSRAVNDTGVLESWLDTIVDSLRVLGSVSRSSHQSSYPNASVSASTSVSASVESSLSSTVMMTSSLEGSVASILGTRLFATPKPLLWDSSLSTLPQEEPLPVDAHSRGHKKPPLPPTPLRAVGASSVEQLPTNKATDQHPAPSKRRHAELVKRRYKRRLDADNGGNGVHSNSVDVTADAPSSDSVVIVVDGQLERVSTSTLQGGVRSCVDMGRDCDVRDLTTVLSQRQAADVNSDDSDGSEQCSPGQLAVMWYERASMLESGLPSLKCYEASVIAARTAFVSSRMSASDSKESNGQQSSSSGWASVLSMLEIRLGRQLASMGSVYEAVCLYHSASQHAVKGSSTQLEAIMLGLEHVVNATVAGVTELPSNNLLRSLKAETLALAHYRPLHWLATALRHFPTEPEVVKRHGMELVRLRSHADAVVSLQSAVTLKQHDVITHHLLACSLLELSRFSDAADVFSDSVYLFHEDGVVFDSVPACASPGYDDGSCGVTQLQGCTIRVLPSGSVCALGSPAPYKQLYMSDMGLMLTLAGKHADAIPTYNSALSVNATGITTANTTDCLCSVDVTTRVRLAMVLANSMKDVDGGVGVLLASSSQCWLSGVLMSKLMFQRFITGSSSTHSEPFGVREELSRLLTAHGSIPHQFTNSYVPGLHSGEDSGTQYDHTTPSTWNVTRLCMAGIVSLSLGRYETCVDSLQAVIEQGSEKEVCHCVDMIQRAMEGGAVSVEVTFGKPCRIGVMLEIVSTVKSYQNKLRTAIETAHVAMVKAHSDHPLEALSIVGSIQVPKACSTWLSHVQAVVTVNAGAVAIAEKSLRHVMSRSQNNRRDGDLLSQVLLASMYFQQDKGGVVKMFDTLLHSPSLSHSLPTLCTRKLRLLSQLLLSQVQHHESLHVTQPQSQDGTLALHTLTSALLEFPSNPLLLVGAADVITWGYGVGYGVLFRAGPSQRHGLQTVLTRTSKLTSEQMTTAVSYLQQALQVLAVTSNNNSSDALVLTETSQPYHPLSDAGLVWNMRGCVACAQDSSWMMLSQHTFRFRDTLAVSVEFRLAWLLFEKGQPSDVRRHFDTALSHLSTLPPATDISVLQQALTLGRCLLDTVECGDVSATVTKLLTSAQLHCMASSLHHTRFLIDVCSSTLYQQIAVILHKRGMDDHSKSLLRFASTLTDSAGLPY